MMARSSLLKSISIFILFIIFIAISFADSEGPLNPSTVTCCAAGAGDEDWFDENLALTSNNQRGKTTVGGLSPTGPTFENSVKLVQGGSITGDDKSTGANLPASDAFASYGGSRDLWGLSWSASDINAADFGVAFAAEGTGFEAGVSSFLKVTNFGFDVNGTINGILVEIEYRDFDEDQAQVDSFRITVTFTPVVDSCTAPGPGDWIIINGDFCTLNVADTITGNLNISDGSLEIQASGVLTISGGVIYIENGASNNNITILSGGQING